MKVSVFIEKREVNESIRVDFFDIIRNKYTYINKESFIDNGQLRR